MPDKKTTADNKYTPGDVAQWMRDLLLKQGGELYQSDALIGIRQTFGEAFVYLSRYGYHSINRKVLRAFRKLTHGAVVWERSEKLWRRRQPTDAKGRMQD
jgi:hypothetical protein